MRLFVGITGLSGTGKDTAGAILSEYAKERGLHVCYYKLSDEIRDELMQQGKKNEIVSRLMLIKCGNELRSQYGDGILAMRILKKVQKNCPSKEGKPVLVMVVGIRNPSEVMVFRKAWGKRFVLLALEASQKTREKRFTLRQQYFGDIELSTEIDAADQAIGINDCVSVADWHIQNESSLRQLKEATQDFLERNIVLAYSSDKGQSEVGNQ